MQKIDRLKVHHAFVKAKSRLFFLDLDGILSPLFNMRTSIAHSGKLKSVLELLTRDQSNQVVIISGKTREDLDAVVDGDIPLMLVAEHGGFFKEPNGKWTARFPAAVFWKSRMLSAMEALVGLYVGSYIEEKYYSVCWHYHLIRNAISDVDVRKILSIFQIVSNRNEFFIDHDNFTIEARTVGIDKGTFAAQWMWGQQSFDFILAMGDNKTDEELFDVVGPDHFTIRIGKSEHSHASYWLDKQTEVESFLSGLITLPVTPS